MPNSVPHGKPRTTAKKTVEGLQERRWGKRGNYKNGRTVRTLGRQLHKKARLIENTRKEGLMKNGGAGAAKDKTGRRK